MSLEYEACGLKWGWRRTQRGPGVLEAQGPGWLGSWMTGALRSPVVTGSTEEACRLALKRGSYAAGKNTAVSARFYPSLSPILLIY